MGQIAVYPTRAEAIKLAAGVWRKANAPEQLLGLAERLNAFLR